MCLLFIWAGKGLFALLLFTVWSIDARAIPLTDKHFLLKKHNNLIVI